MPDSRVNQVHFTDTAAVMLKCCNFLRIRRPQQHRTIATGPAGIVCRIAEIFYPIFCELSLLPRSHVANPKIKIADKCGAPAVGRENAVGDFSSIDGNTFRPRPVALPTALFNVKGDRAVAVFESELRKRKREWRVISSGCGR